MHARRWLCVVLTGLCSAQTHTLQDSHTSENLRGVSAVSATIVWASGTHGIYLRTLDGGLNWTPAQVPGAETLDFRDVEAFSADEAYLLAIGSGEQSRIYKTTDAGKHWTLEFTNPEPKGFFDCMAFWDRTHGIAVGDPVDGKFELITTDDGIHWQPLTPAGLPPAIEGEGAFAASGTCITVQGKSNVWFATGKIAHVFHSADRGKTWSVASTPITQGSDSSGIFSIRFVDDQHGLIAGGDYKHAEQEGPNLASTEDGGTTWRLSPIQHQPFFSAVGYMEPSQRHGLLAVGPARAAFADDVQAKEWLTTLDTNLNALSFVAPGNAWAVGPKGAIMHWAEANKGKPGKN
ncbi:MAG TPA: hypothetical protein VNY29_00995 [Terriglobales bacterium]|jgi:photosystem II stability/assembly factor-like uncharacterized protein|nr:hypothetical protein [Terriglobales bacterium]